MHGEVLVGRLQPEEQSVLHAGLDAQVVADLVLFARRGAGVRCHRAARGRVGGLSRGRSRTLLQSGHLRLEFLNLLVLLFETSAEIVEQLRVASLLGHGSAGTQRQA